MNLQSIIVLAIIIAIMIPAVKSTIAHMKGEGACCGGPKEKAKKKKIKGNKLSEVVIGIEGMHCVNCKNRIENHLNELDGVVAKVNMDKKQAVISLYKDVSREELIHTIEKLGYKTV